MAMIEFDWTLNLPNDHMVDHTQTDGNTRTCTYDGPDRFYMIINNATGAEEMGPITALEKSDGRPCPADCRYVEVDSIANPLIAQLRAPILDELEEDYTGYTSPTGVTQVDGHREFTYQTPLRPMDVYDPETIRVDRNTDEITISPRTREWAIMGGGDRLPTWDDVRAKRDQLLKNSDSELVDDMPAALRTEWTTYRQALRDWPTVMQDAGNPAWAAYNMEPIDPASKVAPPDEAPIVN